MVLATIWNEDELISDTERLEWLVRDHLHPRQEEFRSALQQLRRFIDNRRDEIWEEVDEGPIELGNAAAKPMHTEAVGVVTGEFRTKWLNQQQPPQAEAKSGPINGNLHGQSFTLSNAKVTAQMDRPRRWNRSGMKPTITILGQRSDSGRDVSLTIVVPTALFKKGRSIKVQGRLSDGQRRRRGWGSGMLDGRLTLTRADRSPGAAIEGTFQMRVFEMRR